MRKISSDTLEKVSILEKRLTLEEVLLLANFHSTTLPVEYGDGTFVIEKFICLDELEKILAMVLEELDENTKDYKRLERRE